MIVKSLSLPKYCIHWEDTVELWVEGIVILDSIITDCGIVDHQHHWSTHWRVKGCSQCHCGTADVGSLDGSAVKIETIINYSKPVCVCDSYYIFLWQYPWISYNNNGSWFSDIYMLR